MLGTIDAGDVFGITFVETEYFTPAELGEETEAEFAL